MTAPFEVITDAHAPEPQHLSPDQLARLRALLLEQVALHEAAMAEHDDALTDATEAVIEAAVTSERELAHAVVQITRETTAELEAAIARIDERTYGTCESCSAPIPFERLEAVPETRFCVGCPRPRGLFS